jgi:Ni/Fe-hydrogenase subunit HybB-like protein
MSHSVERPLGGKFFTPGFMVLLTIIGAGAVLVCYRLVIGLGQISAMNDGYPWGIWKPLNVVTFTGIGAGAYAVGLTAYVFNRWQYHTLIRSAIMVGAMAYTLAGTSVLVDLGRWWNLWVVFWPPVYNLNSVLLEVSVCVMSYCGVLWVEITPAVLEELSAARRSRVQRIAAAGLPIMRKAMPFIIALALLLPTMHQASLGGLYMITVTKLHPLWHTAWISGLFLISCLTMGFGAVVVIENLTNLVYKRAVNQRLLAQMAPIPAYLVLAYLVIRFADLAYHGRLGLTVALDFYSVWFWVEVLCFLTPAVLLLIRPWRENRGGLFFASLLLIISGGLYRFDTYLVAFKPAPGWRYFPSAGEMLFSACLISTGIAVYVVMVKLFPIITGVMSTKANVIHDFLRKGKQA